MSLLSISFKILVWFDVPYQLPLNYRYIAFVIFPRCLGYEQPYFIIQVSFSQTQLLNVNEPTNVTQYFTKIHDYYYDKIIIDKILKHNNSNKNNWLSLV